MSAVKLPGDGFAIGGQVWFVTVSSADHLSDIVEVSTYGWRSEFWATHVQRVTSDMPRLTREVKLFGRGEAR